MSSAIFIHHAPGSGITSYTAMQGQGASTHLQHFVCFVKDHNPHSLEFQGALVVQILELPVRAHHDLFCYFMAPANDSKTTPAGNHVPLVNIEDMLGVPSL